MTTDVKTGEMAAEWLAGLPEGRTAAPRPISGQFMATNCRAADAGFFTKLATGWRPPAEYPTCEVTYTIPAGVSVYRSRRGSVNADKIEIDEMWAPNGSACVTGFGRHETLLQVGVPCTWTRHVWPDGNVSPRSGYKVLRNVGQLPERFEGDYSPVRPDRDD